MTGQPTDLGTPPLAWTRATAILLVALVGATILASAVGASPVKRCEDGGEPPREPPRILVDKEVPIDGQGNGTLRFTLEQTLPMNGQIHAGYHMLDGTEPFYRAAATLVLSSTSAGGNLEIDQPPVDTEGGFPLRITQPGDYLLEITLAAPPQGAAFPSMVRVIIAEAPPDYPPPDHRCVEPDGPFGSIPGFEAPVLALALLGAVAVLVRPRRAD